MDISLLNAYNMKKILLFALLSSFLLACEPDLEYEIRGYSQKIIVEGSIANNEYPKVYLSLNVPLWQKVDSTKMLEYVIRTAKVTISDGVKSEILTSRWDKTHFPPYVYKGTELKGEEGKTYYLTVEYSGYTLHSTTTIPYGTDIESFNTSEVKDSDNLKILSMNIDIDPVKKTSFRVFTKKKKDGIYTATPIIYNTKLTLSGPQSFIISPQPTITDPSYDESSYFAVGDTIQIKFCAIDSVSNAFYKDLSFFSTTTGVGSNSFYTEKEPLNSNITKPGFGIWWGYSVRYYQYVIK